MKRSKKAVLVLMMPAAAMWMTGCGEKTEPGVVYSDSSQCSAENSNNPEQCKKDFEAAQALHPAVAPKYKNKQECEADFGAGHCETAPQQSTSGSSMFMPMMMGYLAGSMMNRGRSDASNITPQPLYKSKDDQQTFRSANNSPIASGFGSTQVRPSQVRPQMGEVVQRGGFGRVAHAHTSRSGSPSHFGG